MKSALFLALLATLTTLHARTVIPDRAEDLQITIYNDNLAFVDEKRSVTLPAGEQELVYEGVAKKVITESVIPTFTGAKVRLYSQNFIYNLVTLPALLEKSIDRKVTYLTNGPKPKVEEGILLAAAPQVVVKRSRDGVIYPLEKATQVRFAKIPSGMITRPSLVWHAALDKGGKIGIDLKYLTTGIGWKSAYVLDLGKTRCDLTGWITVNNHSGTTYRNAAIGCVAGALHRAADRTHAPVLKSMRMEAMPAAVEEEAFSGYHLYRIPFRETIRAKEQKQIRFLDLKQIAFQRYGVAQNSYFENYGRAKLSFMQIVTFENSRKNHAGTPLPAGIVRMYAADSRGKRRFVGEDHLKNTSTGERVKLRVGTLFDVVGEKRITRFESDKYRRAVETTYEVRNRSEETWEVRIAEQLPTYGKKITLQSSCKGACQEIRKSAFTREFRVKLKPKGRYRFTTSFEVLY